MKGLLLAFFSVSFSLFSHAQCVADYDFGELSFGVSPDPALGESFEIGELGMDYQDVIHILVPTQAGDVDSAYANINAVIDSLTLISIEVMFNEQLVDLSAIGLDITCNNNGDSPDPCTFMGSQQYCAAIAGIPTLAGTFPLQINVLGHIVIFNSTVSVPMSFDQYTITIDDPNSVDHREDFSFELMQNSPNPFLGVTEIAYTSSLNAELDFTVMNLLGEGVYEETFLSTRGRNVIEFDASELKAGIYLYRVEMMGKVVTKRLVIGE